MKIKPLRNRVFVELDPKVEKTPGGIIIPKTANPERDVVAGVVYEVGPGNPDPDFEGGVQPMEVKAGDRVLLVEMMGKEIKDPEKKLLLVREDDIQARIEE